MLKQISHGFLAIFLASAAGFAPISHADEQSVQQAAVEQMAQWLPGQWWFDFADDGVEMRGVSDYSSDGKVKYTGIVVAEDQKVELNLVGKWRIEGNVLNVEITESNAPEIMPIGTINRDVIVAIDAEKFSYQNAEGKAFTEMRLPKTSAI